MKSFKSCYQPLKRVADLFPDRSRKLLKRKKCEPAAEEKTEIDKFFNKKIISRVRIAVEIISAE